MFWIRLSIYFSSSSSSSVVVVSFYSNLNFMHQFVLISFSYDRLLLNYYLSLFLLAWERMCTRTNILEYRLTWECTYSLRQKSILHGFRVFCKRSGHSYMSKLQIQTNDTMSNNNMIIWCIQTLLIIIICYLLFICEAIWHMYLYTSMFELCEREKCPYAVRHICERCRYWLYCCVHSISCTHIQNGSYHFVFMAKYILTLTIKWQSSEVYTVLLHTAHCVQSQWIPYENSVKLHSIVFQSRESSYVYFTLTKITVN